MSVSLIPPPEGGEPGGSDGQVQYNNSGSFGGISEGSSGDILTSNGVGVPPSFQPASGSGGITELTGDVTAGPGSGSQAATLADTAVTPGSYTNTNLTVDSKGRITAASSGSAGSSGLVLLQSHTASNSATIDFTGFISSSYKIYLFEFVGVRLVSNNVPLNMRFGTGGGPTWDSGSNYFWGRNTTDSSGGGGWTGTGSGGAVTQSLAIFDIDNTDSASSGSGWLRLYDPSNTSLYKMGTFHTICVPGFNPSIMLQAEGGFWYKITTAVTGVRFLAGSGNISVGDFYVYGLST